MVPIPIGTRYTATVAGSTPRHVVCQQCGQEYVYTVEASAEAKATDLFFMHDSAAKARATYDAREALKAELQIAFDPVPCPACGWYQLAMVLRLRQEKYQWMLQLVVACGAICPLVLVAAVIVGMVALGTGGFWASIIAVILGLLTLALGLTAVSLYRLRSKWMAAYNPNDGDVEARKKEGQRIALPKAEYDKMMRELRKKNII